jgi:hypothetical protein
MVRRRAFSPLRAGKESQTEQAANQENGVPKLRGHANQSSALPRGYLC